MAVDEKSMEWQSGLGTSPGMWEMVSDLLIGEALPESINAALYALRDGAAAVVPKRPTEKMIAFGHICDPLSCDVPEDEVRMVYEGIWVAMLREACEKQEVQPNARNQRRPPAKRVGVRWIELLCSSHTRCCPRLR